MSDGKNSLSLPPVLDLAAAAELKPKLIEALASSNAINVDASAVQRVGTPCLQVLAAAAAEAARSGGRLRFHSVPNCFADVVRMLGLSGALGIGEI